MFFLWFLSRDRALRADGTCPKCTSEDFHNVSYPKCTVEDLQNVFHPIKADRRSKNEESCWSLQANVLKVPDTAIVNRDRLLKLGAGYKGGVHKALLRLNHKEMCFAALKTDHCHNSKDQSQLKLTQTGVPCVASNAFRQNDKTYLGGEYTGALVHYMSRRLQTNVPGLLPTYAMVYKKKPLRSRLEWSRLKGNPHTDARVVGSIMPLQDFVPLPKLQSTVLLSWTTQRVSSVMLPAARGLEFLHRLGLVHQDVIDRNIGIVDNERAILFDYTYLSTIGGCQIGCDYCKEDALSTIEFDEHWLPNVTPQQSDALALADIIANMTRIESFQNDLRQIKSSTELVNVLLRYTGQ